MGNPRQRNGHRRRELTKRVKAEEPNCALCGKPIQPGLHYLDPNSGVIDEDIPVSRGGSPLDRTNCHHMHRACNRWKNTMTLTEAKTKLNGETKPTPPVTTLGNW